MAKTITDLSKIPVTCQDVVKSEMASRKAWEGASVNDRAQHVIATVSSNSLPAYPLNPNIRKPPRSGIPNPNPEPDVLTLTPHPQRSCAQSKGGVGHHQLQRRFTTTSEVMPR